MSHFAPRARIRRTMFAALAITAFFTFASPAAAGPLCASGEEFVQQTDGTICRNFFAGGFVNAAFYLFDAGSGFEHLLRITIETVLQDFGLRVRRSLVPVGPIAGFPDYTCVGYGIGGNCVEYLAIDPPVLGTQYLGPVTWLVAWEQPIGTDPMPEIFHDRSPVGATYDELLEGIFFDDELGPRDFTCDNPYTSECEGFGGDERSKAPGTPGDPVRAARSDNFSRVTVGQLANVPEPATLALMGLALGGYVVNGRRRRNAR